MEERTTMEEKLQELAHRMAEAARDVLKLDENALKSLYYTFYTDMKIKQKMYEVERQLTCVVGKDLRKKYIFRRENETTPLLTFSDEGWIVEKRVLRDREIICALIVVLWEILQEVMTQEVKEYERDRLRTTFGYAEQHLYHAESN